MRATGVLMAGYELAAGRERDDLPEDAAARLRACGETHYLDEPSGSPLMSR